MKFLIITHVKHIKQENKFLAYAPYVREMNIWLKHVDEVEIVAPLTNYKKTDIDLAYKHSNIRFRKIPEIEFTSVFNVFKSIFKTPIILYSIFKACFRADHIHLRCPGNIGLFGCLVQVFFPKKLKTAKYAGNWDPKSKQPLSYNIQKKILSSTFLTKNIKTLVYGEWINQSKNIKSFFTATYKKEEIVPCVIRDYNKHLKFLFVGSLVNGKRPLLSIQIVEALNKKGIKSSLDVFGEGQLKKSLEKYINDNQLEKIINIKGNVSKEVLKESLKTFHFLILPSKSEGWPKAIAEAMFFGCIPISTKISCIPYMFDHGKRGILIEPCLDSAIKEIQNFIEINTLKEISKNASNWSQNFTLDVFEEEIKKLLIH